MSFIKDNLFDPNNDKIDMANYFPNSGILSGKMPVDLFNNIKKETEQIKENFTEADFFGNKLAGNIKKEYALKKNKKELEKFLIDKAEDYNRAFNYLSSVKMLSKNANLSMDSAWVNFQSKNEFNPVHSHQSVYSFVGFIRIPYTIDDIINGPGKESNSPCSGSLSFLYTDIFGRVRDYTFRATEKDEGCFLFFPACLSHCVYPFQDIDDYRITISGNLVFNND
jgi:hypothetical protein